MYVRYLQEKLIQFIYKTVLASQKNKKKQKKMNLRIYPFFTNNDLFEWNFSRIFYYYKMFTFFFSHYFFCICIYSMVFFLFLRIFRVGLNGMPIYFYQRHIINVGQFVLNQINTILVCSVFVYEFGRLKYLHSEVGIIIYL